MREDVASREITEITEITKQHAVDAVGPALHRLLSICRHGCPLHPFFCCTVCIMLYLPASIVLPQSRVGPPQGPLAQQSNGPCTYILLHGKIKTLPGQFPPKQPSKTTSHFYQISFHLCLHHRSPFHYCAQSLTSKKREGGTHLNIQIHFIFALHVKSHVRLPHLRKKKLFTHAPFIYFSASVFFFFFAARSYPTRILLKVPNFTNNMPFIYIYIYIYTPHLLLNIAITIRSLLSHLLLYTSHIKIPLISSHFPIMFARCHLQSSHSKPF